jgi:hypothetical protein
MRHHDIEQHEVGRLARCEVEGGQSVARLDDLLRPDELADLAQQHPVGGVVIDDEDASERRRRALFRRRRRCARSIVHKGEQIEFLAGDPGLLLDE